MISCLLMMTLVLRQFADLTQLKLASGICAAHFGTTVLKTWDCSFTSLSP